jgi:hypothetical protein
MKSNQIKSNHNASQSKFVRHPMAGYLKGPKNSSRRATPHPISPIQPQVLGQSLEKALRNQPLNISLPNVELTILGQVDHPVIKINQP